MKINTVLKKVFTMKTANREKHKIESEKLSIIPLPRDKNE